MALDLIGGPVFRLLSDGVKLALEKTTTFKYLLRDLKRTLESLERLRATALQQIGEYNVVLGLPNDEIEDLKKQMEEGAKLVVKLSGFGSWNYCCISCYTDQLVDLDRSLKRLLENLKLQEARDVKEILDLLKKNRIEIDELKGMLQMLLQQRAGKVMETSTSASNIETMPERNEGNKGGEQVASTERKVHLGAVFGMLLDVVIEVEDNTVTFRPLLGDLKSMLYSLKPLIEEIAEDNEALFNLPEEEIEEFRVQMGKGAELVRKCSKICMLGGYKKYKYTNQLLGLDEFLQRQLSSMKEQLTREVNETLVSLQNMKTVVKLIEGRDIIPSQLDINGLCKVAKPLSPTLEIEVMNEQKTRDVINETLVSIMDIEEGFEGIEGNDVAENENEGLSEVIEPPFPPVELEALNVQRRTNEPFVDEEFDVLNDHDRIYIRNRFDPQFRLNYNVEFRQPRPLRHFAFMPWEFLQSAAAVGNLTAACTLM